MDLFKEKREFFPNPKNALIDGLIAVDDTLTVDRLLEAYSFGIFPWPQEELPILWFCPPERGILEFSDYEVSRKFQKFLKKHPFEIKFNSDFEQVINNCRKSHRPGQQGTWITEKIFNAYLKFHEAGYAHSIEAWQGKELVGGLYGVYVAGVFCGESMFYKIDNASKVCLDATIQVLKGNGQSWMDVQMVTPYLESVGAHYISRNHFLQKLEEQKKTAKEIQF